jgi:hypothetical protein
MTFLRRNRERVALAMALVAPVALSAVLVPFRGSFASTAAALTNVVVIVALAVVGSRAAGLLASVSAALWFDFFLTRPYDRFAISHRADLETTIVLVLVGVVVTELAARGRRHARISSEESSYVELLRRCSDLAASRVPAADLVEDVSSSLVELLELRACRFDRLVAHPPLARVLAGGIVDHVGMEWPVDEIGLPGPEAEIVAEWRGSVLGRFVVTPSPGLAISRERLSVAVTMSRIAAAALADDRRRTDAPVTERG